MLLREQILPFLKKKGMALEKRAWHGAMLKGAGGNTILRSDTFSERFSCTMKQTESHKAVSLCKNC